MEIGDKCRSLGHYYLRSQELCCSGKENVLPATMDNPLLICPTGYEE